jgi:hypothetical protein
VVVVLRTNLRLHEHMFESKHRHLPTQNRNATCPPNDPLGVSRQHPVVQRVLLAAIHLSVLAQYVLLFLFETCCRF